MDPSANVPNDEFEDLHISSHPVLKHKMSKIRNKETLPAEFRKLLKDISFILAVEASSDLEIKPVQGLQSPIASYTGVALESRIGISPILRAGIGMTDAFLDIFPEASVFYLGLFRDKALLQPVEYYQKLPEVPQVDTVFLLDPILATGGTAIAACNMLVNAGIRMEQIKLITVLASMPGLQAVIENCKGLQIWCGSVDQVLTNGMIVPGLGDSGDRLFNTFG
ncbi:hypothetical protein MJO28_001886 [Puccinia striiformis f. sp. tritici]|uniref:uracil phosphoribosyltransferase n=2 Tax=Puccinia striiformis f. sp. tritici TaxID=168172 RepID=A0A0L0VV77_9BASI|nr:uncharacterized protein Pst134EA_031867 [Puccinia striiformis f. sp. tritici]KNF02910.1 hypothetical protein PSTG_03856 [Puccinia striiformis f. sp. tritici PST-78]KAH9445143.1 hypothetical protein Pst134EA_031867 [Puccinia striiformis f. sp. tritici]KAH9464435.1 hypothetical protein Pst134EB_003969 [Puccinia striiformis f. sp. tritici]KAI7961397.1 hypothetical protein MJO28_001886 [Puccinia striiformis f. sp. tritici]KAI7966212.1 hypothetical protein MJO29_001960 [Puccinia striiformis f. s